MAKKNKKKRGAAKRTAKNSVFLDLFNDKKYLLQLYQTLHPEDETTTVEGLDIVTIENVLTNNIYNDLGFIVNKDRLLILAEAQSTWSVNIIVRELMYLSNSYREYFLKTSQSVYSSVKVSMPRPEFYVIYSGNEGRKPEEITLSDEFFDGAESGINVRVKVISETNSNDIINQYIIFCKVFDEQRRRLGLTEEMVRATIDICRNKDVLREYLNNREKEVYMIMTSCFDQEVEMKLYIASVRREVREETIAEMKEELKEVGRNMARETAEKLIKKGKMSIEEIAECVPSLSIEELKEIEAQVTTQDTANI
jgi:hypothetical protein